VSTVATDADTHPLLTILDCPDCRAGHGLVPQTLRESHYLACEVCEFWYPIVDEVVLLLGADRNEHGLRRKIGPPTPLRLERRPTQRVDVKALIYSFYIRLHEFATRFAMENEPLVVDVGCSTGSTTSWLRPDQTYIGFDISFTSLRFARRVSGQFFVQADATRLPIKNGSAPFLISREVLEHLPDPLRAIQELSRVAARAAVVVPTLDFPFLYDPINWILIRRGQRAKFGVYGYGHERLYDVAGWRRLLEEGGMCVVAEHPIGTGMFLNAFDVVWHSLYSWREFDGLPRHGAPIQLARSSFRLWEALHRLDGPLLPTPSLSRAFEVFPRPGMLTSERTVSKRV
jgi:SAM-dependent methyltransferase